MEECEIIWRQEIFLEAQDFSFAFFNTAETRERKQFPLDFRHPPLPILNPNTKSSLSCLQGELAGGELAALPVDLAGNDLLLVPGQLATLGPGELGAEVEGLVLAFGVELTKVILLVRVHDDVDAGDGLPNRAAAGD